MNKKNIKININNGFVLLYTMVVSSIILAVAFGVTSIALKEANFSTSAKATNEAFFAADTGAECTLFYDKTNNNAFIGNLIVPLDCVGSSNDLSPLDLSLDSPSLKVWDFTIYNLGNSGESCAVVNVSKDLVLGTTKIISKGYDDCNSRKVERELEVNY